MKKTLFILILCLLQVIEMPAERRLRVACIGNSVTYGTRLDNRERDAYPAQLQKLLGEKYDVRNFGRPSATLLTKGPLPYTKLKEYQEAKEFKADYVIIHLGLNDTDPHCWPNHRDEFIKDYRALIDTFRAVNPAAKIWVCHMTPIFHRHKRFQSSVRDWHAEIQQKIKQVARTCNVGLIDFYYPLHIRPELFPDALHPNPEGAAIMAQKAYGAITGDFGGLQMPVTYGDGMVLQRQKPIYITGKANVGEQVSVSLNKKKLLTKASGNGEWRVEFPAQEAGGPYTLKISASSGEKTYHDVWVGEVWLCSGQSNMFFPLEKAATAQKDLAQAEQQTRLHLYYMPRQVPNTAEAWDKATLDTLNRLHYVGQGIWKRSNAESARLFSAIGYHFGRVLADSLDCHIGLICNAMGGTNIESWIDRTTIETDYPNLLYNWLQNDFIAEKIRKRAAKNLANKTNPLQRHHNEPCYLFESAIEPLKDFTIRGVIWYQGEANSDKMELHSRLFPLLEKSWRTFFNDEELPFHFVQLSSYFEPSWPHFRNSQRKLAQQLPYTWMTVSSDLGVRRNIHPTQKQPVGERLAASALNRTYHYQHVVPSGPEFIKAQYHGNKVLLSFRYDKNLHASQGKSLKGFELAGPDGIYYPAKAHITAEGLTITSTKVKEAQAVRYGWQPFSEGNLINETGMPCSTFQDEQFR